MIRHTRGTGTLGNSVNETSSLLLPLALATGLSGSGRVPVASEVILFTCGVVSGCQYI